jgi:hypothetical protein
MNMEKPHFGQDAQRDPIDGTHDLSEADLTPISAADDAALDAVHDEKYLAGAVENEQAMREGEDPEDRKAA